MKTLAVVALVLAVWVVLAAGIGVLALIAERSSRDVGDNE